MGLQRSVFLVAPLQAQNQHLGAGQIGGHRHIVLVAEPDGLQHLLAVPGVYGIGVGKQQHHIDFVIRNPGVHLLVTALLMGQQQRNGQARRLRHQTSGGGRCKEGMLGKDALICRAELDH